MHTGKIGLRKFLYERRVPGVEDKEYNLCGGGEQIVHHILSMCLEVLGGKEGHMEEGRKGACMEQYHHKINANLVP